MAGCAVAWLLSSGSGCGGPQTSTLERVQAAGVVRIGYANEAPYAYRDSEAERVTGEAPEIAREVLASMGIEKIEGVLTEFSSLIPGLKARRFDLIAAGMYITPPRAEQVDFSRPTYKIGLGLAVPAGNPQGLHSLEDVRDNEDVRMGVLGGGVEKGWSEAVGVPSQRIVVFPDPPSALDGLRARRVDAYLGTSLTISDILARAADASVERAEPFTDPIVDGKPVTGYGAFAFRPEDDPFRKEFDRHLEAFLGTPKHRQLVAPFGFTEAEMPGGLTATEVLARQEAAGPKAEAAGP